MPLTVSVPPPANGTVVVLNSPGTPATLRIRYTPNADWYGTEVFTYRVTDLDGQFDTATVTVVVAPVNDVPVANDDAFNVSEDVLTLLDVVLNDWGLGDTPLSLQILSGPSNGTAVVIGSPGTPATLRIRYLSDLRTTTGRTRPDVSHLRPGRPGHRRRRCSERRMTNAPRRR